MSQQETRKGSFTYRVEGLPRQCTFSDAERIIEAAVGLDPQGCCTIRVHSLAKSALVKDEMTATISSDLLDNKMQGGPQSFRRTYQVVPLPAVSPDTGTQTDEIIVDTVFDGYTPLNSFDDPKEHKFEYGPAPTHLKHARQEANVDPTVAASQ
jgi:hypothetical protein